jgi:DNA topoisomerase I
VGLPAQNPIVAAKVAGLRYVTDRTPGIRRIGTGKASRYIRPDGHVIRNSSTLARIRALAIPPAWTDVWICPFEEGHLQAVGRDARKRKQYRYHHRWREVRDSTKFDRMADFGKALPRIRARVKRDLARPDLPKEKVLATIVRLLETTLIRVGNEEYTKQNNSFGLTTLRNHHVDVSGPKVSFYFRGKSGRRHAISVKDPHLAKIVRRCRDLPGYELFQYIDEAGERHAITSTDVNDYLREISEDDFTAKDFRTWAGTVIAIEALCACEKFKSQKEAKKNVLRVVEQVSAKLGNTVAVCRKCYIHPAVFETYEQGILATPPAGTRSRRERAFVHMIRRWSKPKAKLSLAGALVKSIEAQKKK